MAAKLCCSAFTISLRRRRPPTSQRRRPRPRRPGRGKAWQARRRTNRRDAAPAQEHRQIGDQERLDHAGWMLGARPVQANPDRVSANRTILAGPEGFDGYLTLEAAGTRLREEHDRPRRMPLGETGEDV